MSINDTQYAHREEMIWRRVLCFWAGHALQYLQHKLPYLCSYTPPPRSQPQAMLYTIGKRAVHTSTEDASASARLTHSSIHPAPHYRIFLWTACRHSKQTYFVLHPAPNTLVLVLALITWCSIDTIPLLLGVIPR